MTLETGAEMVKESSCTVATQEVPSRALWKAIPWNFHSKYWTQGLALPQKGELLQSPTGNFLQPKQTVTFWQAMWKKTTTTTTNNCLLLLCHKVALLLQLAQPLTSTQIRAASTSIIKELILYTRIQLSKKKREVLTSLNFTCCCSLSTESVIACISDAPYFCWIMFSIPLSNALST